MIGTIHYGVHKSKLFAYHNYIFTVTSELSKEDHQPIILYKETDSKTICLFAISQPQYNSLVGIVLFVCLQFSFLCALISVSCSHKKSPWSEFRLSYILFFVMKSLTNHFYFYCLSIRFTGIYILFLQPLLIIYN